MKDWIMELCPEIAEWQAELIAERVQAKVAAEREACARVCDDFESNNKWSDAHGYDHVFAAAIRARGEK